MKIQTKTPRSALATLLTLIFAGLLGALSVNTAHGQIYASLADVSKKVVEYSLSGTQLSPSLVSPVTNPYGLAVNSTTLFVADFGASKIGSFDIASSTYTAGFISLGAQPYGVAVSGNALYVSLSNGSILKYDATTHMQDLGFSASVANAFFMAVDASGNLYVASKSGNTVTKYNGSTGGLPIGTPISVASPTGIAFDASGNIYVASYSGNTVTQYNSSGLSPVTFANNLHISSPNGIGFDSAGNLYVGSYVGGFAGTVAQFSSTGSFLSTITTGGNVFGVAVGIPVPEPSAIVLLSLGGVVLLGGLLRKKLNPRLS